MIPMCSLRIAQKAHLSQHFCCIERHNELAPLLFGLCHLAIRAILCLLVEAEKEHESKGEAKPFHYSSRQICTQSNGMRSSHCTGTWHSNVGSSGGYQRHPAQKGLLLARCFWFIFRHLDFQGNSRPDLNHYFFLMQGDLATGALRCNPYADTYPTNVVRFPEGGTGRGMRGLGWWTEPQPKSGIFEISVKFWPF